MTRLALFVLGTPRLERDGVSVRVQRRKVMALLIYLAVTGESHTRDTLAVLFWPNEDQSHARAALRRTLSELNKIMGVKVVKTGVDSLALSVSPDFWLDVGEFHHRLEESHTHPHLSSDPCSKCLTSLSEATHLYRADFLTGFTLRDSDGFDDWMSLETESLRRELTGAFKQLVYLHQMRSEVDQALFYARRWLAIDLTDEAAHRNLMQLYAASGQRSAVLQQYQECTHILGFELGISPTEETIRLYERICSKEDWSQTLFSTRDVQQKTNSAMRITNLPIQLTSFIGRETEIMQIKDLLAQHRLVTLTGSGGCGKTRLGFQAAGEMVDLFPDGVWLVELARLADPNRVVYTVGRAVGLIEAVEPPILEQLLLTLQERQMLLVMDNCEHLIEACAELCSLIMNTCLRVKILATSRQALYIEGERTFQVPSLSTPDLSHPLELEAIGQCTAVRLFVERAETVLPNFHLTEDNAIPVAQVCTRLDGIPLAIELAAARVKLLQVKEISKRLDDRFHLLTGGNRAAVPRQQTLRACIDWSYALLTEEERHLLLHLSVFAGGWTLDAAEAVCGEAFTQGEDTLNLLTQLVDRSMVQTERKQGQETRFSLLETIRQYGHEKLVEAGEAGQVRQRHLEYFVRLAEQAEPELHSPSQRVWLRRLQVELDNLRWALEWSLAERSEPDWWPEQGIRLACALLWFWDVHDNYAEAAEWLERLLLAEKRQRGEQPLSVEANPGRVMGRARALQNLGLNLALGGYETSSTSLTPEAVSEESRALYQQLGPAGRYGLACALFTLGVIKRGKYDNNQSEILFKESIALFQEMGDKSLTANCLFEFGFIAHRKNDLKLAKDYFEQSLALHREIGDLYGEAHVLCHLGWLAHDLEGYGKATSLVLDGLQIFEELDLGGVKIKPLCFLGLIAWDKGQYQQALNWFDQAVQVPRRRGGSHWTVDPQLYKVRVALSQGEYDQALVWIQGSLEAGRKWRNFGWIALALLELGEHSWATQQYFQAGQLYSEALSVSRDHGFRLHTALALCGMGKTALMSGNLAEARGFLSEAFCYFQLEIGNIESMALNLPYVVVAAIQARQIAHAVRLLAASEEYFNRYKNWYLPADRQLHEDNLTKACLALGEEAFTAAWEDGKVMTVQQMLELVLEVLNVTST